MQNQLLFEFQLLVAQKIETLEHDEQEEKQKQEEQDHEYEHEHAKVSQFQ